MSEIFAIPFSTDLNTQDILYSAEDLQGFNRAFYNNGLQVNIKNNADLQILSGLSVNINPFGGHVDGVLCSSSKNTVITLDPANSLPRIDSIIIRRDAVARKAYLIVKQGVPSGNPLPPSLVEIPKGIYEFRLYDIMVDAYAVFLANQDITDRRIYMWQPTLAEWLYQLSLKIDKSTLGQPDGTATLDAGGKVPENQLSAQFILNLLNSIGGVKMRGLNFAGRQSVAGNQQNPLTVLKDGLFVSFSGTAQLYIRTLSTDSYFQFNIDNNNIGIQFPIKEGTQIYIGTQQQLIAYFIPYVD